MRDLGGRTLLSPTDLMRFMGCRHARTLDIANMQGGLPTDAATMRAALAEGAEVVFEGAFQSGNSGGSSNAVERVYRPSALPVFWICMLATSISRASLVNTTMPAPTLPPPSNAPKETMTSGGSLKPKVAALYSTCHSALPGAMATSARCSHKLSRSFFFNREVVHENHG